MEYDGYNENLALAFEYNGAYWHSKEKVKFKDNRKVELSIENGINLIVVEQFKNLKLEYIVPKILKLCLEKGLKSQLKIQTTADDNLLNIDISSAFDGTTNQIVFSKKVKEMGGVLVDESVAYMGLEEKREIYCHNPLHSSFKHTPRYILYKNGWCNECNREKKAIIRLQKLKLEFREFIEAHNFQSNFYFGLELVFNPLEPLFDPYYTYQWKCKNNHIHKMSFLKMRELHKRNKKTSSWCLQCKHEEKNLESVTVYIKKIEKKYDVNFLEFNENEKSVSTK